MLGSPVKSIEEIVSRYQGIPMSAEFKYDGERAQIHFQRTENTTRYN